MVALITGIGPPGGPRFFDHWYWFQSLKVLGPLMVLNSAITGIDDHWYCWSMVLSRVIAVYGIDDLGTKRYWYMLDYQGDLTTKGVLGILGH